MLLQAGGQLMVLDLDEYDAGVDDSLWIGGESSAMMASKHLPIAAVDMPFRKHMCAAAQHGVMILVSMTCRPSDGSCVEGYMVLVAEYSNADWSPACGVGVG